MVPNNLYFNFVVKYPGKVSSFTITFLKIFQTPGFLLVSNTFILIIFTDILNSKCLELHDQIKFFLDIDWHKFSCHTVRDRAEEFG